MQFISSNTKDALNMEYNSITEYQLYLFQYVDI